MSIYLSFRRDISMKFLVPSLLLVLTICFVNGSMAADFNLDSPYNKSVWRFEINNDIIFNSDSNFTNGWSLQYHTRGYESWAETQAFDWVKGIGRSFPTLNDEGSIVRYGQGIGQNLITPGDITNPNPDPEDLPYAATFHYTLNWQSYNPESARTFQVTAGVLGEEAFGEDVQTFVHNDLGMGDTPRGWHTERDSEPILNLGYQYLRRVAKFGDYDEDWAGQLMLGTSFHLGNLATLADVSFAFRYGWNMMEGFSAYPTPPGRGMFSAYQVPKSASSSPHGFEFILGIRGTALGYSVLYDGSFITDDEREVGREDFYASAGLSLNYHHYDMFSVHLGLLATTDILDDSDLPQPPPGGQKTRNDTSYGTLMIDFRF